MTKGKTTPAQAVTPHRYTEDEFRKRYESLCKETGFVIGFEPRWVQSMDQGDYRLVIAWNVVPIPKKVE